MSSGTGSQITRLYGSFRGVDFRGEDGSISRSPDSLNMWKDYRETDSIRTRPGLELLAELPAPINGIFFPPGGRIFLHSGTEMYELDTHDGSLYDLYLEAYGIHLNDMPSQGFVYENMLYFKDGRNYLRCDGETIFFDAVEGYVPTTSIARKPAGGGTIYQDVNMLTGRRINTFLADGTSMEYYLDAKNLDEDFEPIVKVNDVVMLREVTDSEGIHRYYTVDYEKGVVTFLRSPPPAPLTDGQDNVSIEFSKTVPGYREAIEKCTLLQVFDNRVFFSGNPEYPNVVWHCSLNDPTYVSDLDYYREGMDNAQVKGLVAGNNALWVFREPSEANTNVFYHTPTLDSEYGKIYPSTHSSVSTGCVGKAINFNDDIVFFSDRGMEGISGDVTTEQVVAHRSTLVDRRLIAEPNYKDMILAEWEGYLLVFIDSHVYLADSRTAFTLDDHIEYEWFYWDLGQEVTCVKVIGGVLYLGMEDGLYTLTDMEACLESYWVTPKDKFQYPSMRKTTNKKGCVAEATGDIAVYAKTESTDFELIGTYENVEDYFVSRIKRKKFKDLQLKFHSYTRFSLETVSLEVFVGAYVKR